MMKLEDICCSLELAKELKEIGINQESLFSWFVDNETGKSYLRNTNEYYLLHDKDAFNCYSAFTASELINILPCSIKSNINKFLYLRIDKEPVFFDVKYTDNIGANDIFTNRETSLAASLSELLIYIINNKIISVEVINERI